MVPTVTADAESAGRTRKEFARWLDEHFDLDPIRSSDLVLATNEALANAAEFAYLLADRPGTMAVHARHHPDGKLIVTVSDNGTGIPPTQQERIWRLFHTTRPADGSGIGLALVKRLVEAQGGQVRVESTLDEGSRFHVRWPKVPPGTTTIDGNASF